jgi:hypothetical protein
LVTAIVLALPIVSNHLLSYYSLRAPLKKLTTTQF